MIHSGQLHPLARRVILRAREWGALIDPIDHFIEIQRLHLLATEISNPPILEMIDLLDAPIVIDGLALRRPSWAAQTWLAESAAAWFQDDGWLFDLACIWALVHARDKTALQSVASPTSARQIILEWAKSSTANFDALIAAARHLIRPAGVQMPVPPEKDEGRKEEDAVSANLSAGPILMTLLTETDKPLDYWIFAAPVEITDAALARIQRNWEADSKRMAAAIGKNAYHCADDWRVKATKRFNQAARDFVAAHSEAQAVEVKE